MNGVVDQIHQFAHPPALNFSPIKVKHLIDHAIADAKKQVQQEIAFSSSIDPNVPVIEADERALGESLLHLLVNAAEALADVNAPKVEISADVGCGTEGEQQLRLRVCDNGSGMSEDTIAQAFSPFYTTKARGMGLGLPIVKRTALDHNGVVDLSSSGSGLLVTINLPISGS